MFGVSGIVTFSGANIQVSGTTVGTFTNTGGTFTITFNGSATSARVDSVLQAITYSNNSDNPPASAQINYTFNDGNAGAQGTGTGIANGSVTVAITPTNDAPTTDLNGGIGGTNSTAAFTEQTPVLIAPSGTVSDIDSTNLSSLTVTLINRPDGNGVETLSLNAAAESAAEAVPA